MHVFYKEWYYLIFWHINTLHVSVIFIEKFNALIYEWLKNNLLLVVFGK